jgi:deazaflavin-dependent oxidoreductase (nitroreductase family)
MPEGRRPGGSQQPVIDEFRARGGLVSGFYAEMDLLLLTTVGVRSGRPHVAPLSYVTARGGRYVVAAAGGGSPHHPDWYLNLLADDHVVIEVGTAAYAATAVTVTGDEREDLYQHVADRYPVILSFQAGRARPIPLVAVTVTGSVPPLDEWARGR